MSGCSDGRCWRAHHPREDALGATICNISSGNALSIETAQMSWVCVITTTGQAATNHESKVQGLGSQVVPQRRNL
eukprot:13186098-Alexandrium_andersonii.AAC.1